MTDHAHDLIEQSKREERLSTAVCARALGVSTAFIRGEIQDGRLPARVFKPEGRKHAKYIITADVFHSYVERYWPKAGDVSREAKAHGTQEAHGRTLG